MNPGPCIGRQSLNHWTTREVSVSISNSSWPLAGKFNALLIFQILDAHVIELNPTAIKLYKKQLIFRDFKKQNEEIKYLHIILKYLT